MFSEHFSIYCVLHLCQFSLPSCLPLAGTSHRWDSADQRSALVPVPEYPFRWPLYSLWLGLHCMVGMHVVEVSLGSHATVLSTTGHAVQYV